MSILGTNWRVEIPFWHNKSAAAASLIALALSGCSELKTPKKECEVPEVVYRGRIADRRIIPPPPARASRAAACVTMKLRAARAEPQPRRCPPGAPVQYSQREIAAGDLAIPQRKACGDLVRRPFIRPILNARRSASALTTRLSCSLLGSMSWDLMPLVDPMPSST